MAELKEEDSHHLQLLHSYPLTATATHCSYCYMVTTLEHRVSYIGDHKIVRQCSCYVLVSQ